MTNLNRRQWLRLSGLTGAATMVGGWKSLANSPSFLGEMAPPNPNDIIKLSSNENPYGPSPKVREAMTGAFDLVCRYPHGHVRDIETMIAEKHGVEPDQVVTTAGSTEGLRISGLTYGMNGGEIVAANPVFKALLTYAEQFGAYIHRVPLTEDLQHDLEAMERRITTGTRLVFMCNPNNPTGTLLPPGRFRDFCESVSHKAVVFSDEAYFDYIAEPNYPSMIELVKKGLNVIVSRTFSKVYGLAGIRIGYLIARPDIAARLRKNIVAAPNMLAIHAAKAALNDEEFYHFSLKKNLEARDHLYQTLDDLNLSYQKSQTNFVFFKTGREVQTVIADVLSQGVRVGRPFPPLTDWCRVSMGTIEEMGRLRQALGVVFG